MNFKPSLDTLLLPHESKRWPEIKQRLLEIVTQPTVDIIRILSQLDYIENLVHLDQPIVRLFDFLPLRMTFVGLGTFIVSCICHVERHHLQNTLLPFIYRLAMHCETYAPESLPLYCMQQKAYDVSIPLDLVACMIACSFLCLLPVHMETSLLFNEVNFSYFFGGIVDETSYQVNKLRSLLSYFECCRLESERTHGPTLPDSLRIVRRVLHAVEPKSLLPNKSQGPLSKFLVWDAISSALVKRLHSIRLPLLLTDHYNSVEVVADRLRIPMAYFVNAYIGGSILRSGGIQEDTFFMRYPDLLASLILCHRLDEFEAIWVDRFRGPFLPTQQIVSSPVEALCPPQASLEAFKWRRLVMMDTSCFPSWASELQYSEACITSEVMKATAAFYGKHELGAPFNQCWWSDSLNFSNESTGDYWGKRKPKVASKLRSTDPSQPVEIVNLLPTKRTIQVSQLANCVASGAVSEAVQEVILTREVKSVNAKTLGGSLFGPDYCPAVLSLMPSVVQSVESTCNSLSQQRLPFSQSSCSTPIFVPHPKELSTSIENEVPFLQRDLHCLTVLKPVIDELVSQSMDAAVIRISHLHTYAQSLLDRILHDATVTAARLNHSSGRPMSTAALGAGNWQLIKGSSRSTVRSPVFSTGGVVSAPAAVGPMRHISRRHQRGDATLADRIRRSSLQGCQQYSWIRISLRRLSEGSPSWPYPKQMDVVSKSVHKLSAANTFNALVAEAAPRQPTSPGLRDSELSSSGVTRFQVSDTLSRLTGSLVSECCTLALQHLHLTKTKCAAENRHAEPVVPHRRPPGLVTTCWSRRTVNSAADPQVKAMTQWIAAAISVARGSSVVDHHVTADDKNDEQRASPLIICSNGDVRLKKLDEVADLIHQSGCSTGDLLSLLYDYNLLRCSYPCPTSTVDTTTTAREPSGNRQSSQAPSLFQYLIDRLTGGLVSGSHLRTCTF